MAALILAMRLVEASLSFVLSRDKLLRGVKTGERLRIEVEAEAVLEVEGGAVLRLAADAGAALLGEPLTLRKASMGIVSTLQTAASLEEKKA